MTTKFPDNFYETIRPRLHRRIGHEMRLAHRVLDRGCGSCDLVRYLASAYGQAVMRLAGTSGQERNLWRWGEFRFRLAGRQCALQACRSGPAERRRFVPFRDGTSGKETYGAGRHLDLEPQTLLSQDGKWVVDFNDAYNPSCAYSEHYVCPFVRPQNGLGVAVRAGEKKYPPGKE